MASIRMRRGSKRKGTKRARTQRRRRNGGSPRSRRSPSKKSRRTFRTHYEFDEKEYYTETLDSDELIAILKNIWNKEEGRNWILVGTPTNTDFRNNNLHNIKNSPNTNSVTKFFINHEGDEADIKKSEIKKINDAILKAIPDVDNPQDRDKPHKTPPWRIASNDWGAIVGMPISIAVGNGKIISY